MRNPRLACTTILIWKSHWRGVTTSIQTRPGRINTAAVFGAAMSFLDESEQQARRVTEQAEQSRQRELRQAKDLVESRTRSAALLKRLAVAVGAACLIAVVLAVWAMNQSRIAKENALVAKRETARANVEKLNAKKSARQANLLANEARILQQQALEAASVANQALGKTWLTTANVLANDKDRFSARLKAARAIGFQGHGRASLDDDKKDEFSGATERGYSSVVGC